MDLLNHIVMYLPSIDVKIKDEGQALMLLCLLLNLYKNFIDMMLYERLSITRKRSRHLNLKELRKSAMESLTSTI